MARVRLTVRCSLLAVLIALAGCGARSYSPGDDDDIAGGPGGDADADPGGEGEQEEDELEPGPGEPDGICTEAERSFHDTSGWIWTVDPGVLVEDCNLCDGECEDGNLRTFRQSSGRPFDASAMVSNCRPAEIVDPVHVLLYRLDAAGEEIVIGDGWTPAPMPAWSAVWVTMEVHQDQCGRGVSDRMYFRLDADDTVAECDETDNETDLRAGGC